MRIGNHLPPNEVLDQDMIEQKWSDAMAEEFKIGTWRVRPSCNQIVNLASGEATHMEPKLMSLLLALLRRPHETVRREELFRSVWAETFVGQEVLWRGISELRRILGDNSKAPLYIETVPRVGYRFIGPLTPFQQAPARSGSSYIKRSLRMPLRALARPAMFVFGMIFGLAVGPLQTGLQVSDSPALEALSLPLACCAASSSSGGHDCQANPDCCHHD